MKVLVTGATGFVGSALIRALVRQGAAVVATCRREPSPMAGIHWARISGLDDQPAMRAALRGCDAVVHLAALAHQTGQSGHGRAEEFQAVNVESTRLLARWAREAQVSRFVFMSSVAAVCSQNSTPVNETTAARPDSDYGRSKLQAEMSVQSELRGSGTDWCALRAPLVYGPGNPGNMARLLDLIARGLPLPFAAIHNCRSFIYIDNLVDALMRVLWYPRPIGRAFFVSDGSNLSTPELISALARASGLEVRLWGMPVRGLRMLGRLGDALQRVGVGSPLDSYSVDRLVGSMAVSGALFNQTFSWQPPVQPEAALQLTGTAYRRKQTR